MQPRRAFQDAFNFFLEQVVPVCQESDEYKELTADRLREVLLLADRVVAACDQQQDNGQVVRVCDHLATADAESGEELLAELERWLKGVWWLLDPDGWRQARDAGEAGAATGKKSNKFSLFAVLVGLKLLTPAEADKHPKEHHTFPDRVRGLLLLAKEERNSFIHDGKLPPLYRLQLQRQAAAVGLLAPVFKHAHALRTALERLVTAPLTDDTEADLNNGFSRFIQSVASERRRHLDHFAGRERWLKTVRDHLEHTLRERGGYLLLSAPEGTGKSALVAKASELLAVFGAPLGPAAEAVRRLAPWLPGPLLHMGKQSSDPDEIVRLLLAQANALLLRPVNAAHGFVPGDEHTDAELGASALFRGKLAKASDRVAELFTPTATARTLDGVRRSERPHRLVFEALERVRDERGAAVLIVDALEEISRDGGHLDFLPPTLPQGVTALLTVRQNTPAERWVRANLHNVTALTLDGIDRADVPQITGVPDDDPAGKKFNDQVRAQTSGVALTVRHIADDVRNCGGDIRKVVIAGSLDALYRRQAGVWRSARPEGFAKGLDDVLQLLCIFAPVGWLSREMIQGYLSSRGVTVSSLELDDALQPVAAQLVGLNEDRLRLAVRAFGEHLRNKVFNKRETADGLRAVGKWLAADPDVLPEAAGAFLRYWGGVNGEPRLVKVAEETLKLYREAGRWEALTHAATLINSNKRLVPIAESALRAAAEGGHPRAMRLLGSWLLRGQFLERKTEQGLDWLRRAAECDDAPAIEILADHFFTKKRDAAEGVRWLRLGIDRGHVGARRALGWRLLNGKAVPAEPSGGMALLRPLTAANDTAALSVLGTFLTVQRWSFALP